MVRPKRVKARVLKQPDRYRVPKKFRRFVAPRKPTVKKNSGFDWWLAVYIVLGLASLSLLIFWIHTITQP